MSFIYDKSYLSTKSILFRTRFKNPVDYLNHLDKIFNKLVESEEYDCIIVTLTSLVQKIKDKNVKLSLYNCLAIQIPLFWIAFKLESDFYPSGTWLAEESSIPIQDLLALERYLLSVMDYHF